MQSITEFLRLCLYRKILGAWPQRSRVGKAFDVINTIITVKKKKTKMTSFRSRGSLIHYYHIFLFINLFEAIDLFGLYILFSQYRSCDNTQEAWSFVLFIKKSACRHSHACMPSL